MQQKGNQNVDSCAVGAHSASNLKLSEQVSGHSPADGSVEPTKYTTTRSEKLKEITELTRMHYPPHNARLIVNTSFQAVMLKDDSLLDHTLEYLGKIPYK